MILREENSEVTPKALPKPPSGHKRRNSKEFPDKPSENETNPKANSCENEKQTSTQFMMSTPGSLVLSKVKIPEKASVKELQILLMEVNQKHQKKRFALDKWYDKQKTELTC